MTELSAELKQRVLKRDTVRSTVGGVENAKYSSQNALATLTKVRHGPPLYHPKGVKMERPRVSAVVLPAGASFPLSPVRLDRQHGGKEE